MLDEPTSSLTRPDVTALFARLSALAAGGVTILYISHVLEVVEKSQELLKKPFSSSHANQMLAALGNAGLVYKNRHGKYSFAVPLLGPYILRTHGQN